MLYPRWVLRSCVVCYQSGTAVCAKKADRLVCEGQFTTACFHSRKYFCSLESKAHASYQLRAGLANVSLLSREHSSARGDRGASEQSSSSKTQPVSRAESSRQSSAYSTAEHRAQQNANMGDIYVKQTQGAGGSHKAEPNKQVEQNLSKLKKTGKA